MTSSNYNKHLTLSDRVIIETGIYNSSSKKSIADTVGRDKSTIGKEILSRRTLTHKFSLPLECAHYKKCSFGRSCTNDCPDYTPFKCSWRDRSPGACNGCSKFKNCRFNKYLYRASDAQHSYELTLKQSRAGFNTSEEELIRFGTIIEPLIKKGLSPYSILIAHPEIQYSEKTIYHYIESHAFQNVGINLCAMDLRRQASRKISTCTKNTYKIRKD